MIVNLSQSDIDKYSDTRPKRSEKQNSHSILKSCLFFFVLIVGLGVLLFHNYFSIIGSLLSITGQTVKEKVSVPQNKITYNNGKLINILALGSDTDEKFTNGSFLTQTMIIISINPSTNTVNMISIPRDSWVQIPGYGTEKIDTASGDGGIPLAIQTVEEDYGIKIDHYAWVGLQGFIKVIDTFGGVNIDVKQPILDEEYPQDLTGDPKLLYAAQRLDIPAGPQHLNGYDALEYVRSRHGNLLGDFSRSQRQQELLLALKQQVNTSSLISNLPTILSELQGSVKTDMSLVDLTNLATYAKSIKSSDIHQYVLLPPVYGTNGQSSAGEDIVEPNWTAIQTLFNKLFTQG